MADREVKLKLGIDFTEGTAAQKALAGIGAAATTSAKVGIDALKKSFASLNATQSAQYNLRFDLQEQGRLKAVEGIEASYRRQRETVASLKEALNPDLLRERVKLSIQESDARRELAKAAEAEFQRQRPSSLLNKLTLGAFGSAGGSKADAGVAGGSMGSVPAAVASLGPAALTAASGLLSFHAVALASPGTMERFRLVLEDTIAVVGQRLMPVAEFLTSIIKTFGDVLATVLPPANSFREILAPISEVFRNLAEALAPVLSIIQDVLIVALKALAVAVQIVLLPFKFVAEVLKALFGGDEAEKLKSSTGAAARSISFTSSEAGAKAVYAAAYKSSTGQDRNDIPSWFQKVLDVLKAISSVVTAIAKAVAGTIKAAGEAVPIFDIAKNLREHGIALPTKQIEAMEILRKKEEAEADTSGIDRGGNRTGASMTEGARDTQEFREWAKTGNDGDGWLKRMIDQAKRRFQDGHPGGA